MSDTPYRRPDGMTPAFLASAHGLLDNNARLPDPPKAHAIAAVQLVGLLAFSLVLFDAIFVYFTSWFFDAALPVNVLIAPILIGIVIRWGLGSVIPPAAVSAALALGVLGFFLGLILLPSISSYRIIEIAGGLGAFLVGYFCLRWSSDEDRFGIVMLLIGGLYAVVSIIALHGLGPEIFRVVNQYWAYEKAIIVRPEVMTDQNFQVFYSIPAVLALALPYRFPRFWFVLVAMVSSLYVLLMLQTRSGTLVYVGAVVICLLVPLWHRALGRGKVLIVPLFMALLVVFYDEQLLESVWPIMVRFFEADYDTGYLRLEGLAYVFEKFFDLQWWLPRGSAEFESQYGSIPHSNVTAMYLDGGILGLYLWIAVFLAPLLMLACKFFRGQADPLSVMVLVGGTASLAVQLSLNVPFFKQPWLWAGAVVGTLCRLQHYSSIRRRQARQ